MKWWGWPTYWCLVWQCCWPLSLRTSIRLPPILSKTFDFVFVAFLRLNVHFLFSSCYWFFCLCQKKFMFSLSLVSSECVFCFNYFFPMSKNKCFVLYSIQFSKIPAEKIPTKFTGSQIRIQLKKEIKCKFNKKTLKKKVWFPQWCDWNQKMDKKRKVEWSRSQPEKKFSWTYSRKRIIFSRFFALLRSQLKNHRRHWNHRQCRKKTQNHHWCCCCCCCPSLIERGKEQKMFLTRNMHAGKKKILVPNFDPLWWWWQSIVKNLRKINSSNKK